jgi:hypothetical protein
MYLLSLDGILRYIVFLCFQYIAEIGYLLIKASFSSAMCNNFYATILILIYYFAASSRVLSSYKESCFRNFTMLRYKVPSSLSFVKLLTP